MVDTFTELESTKQTLTSTQAELGKTKSTLKKTEEELGTTKTRLTKTTADLKETTANLAAKEKEATDLSEDLLRTTAERNTAQQEVAVWKAMRVTPDGVKKMMADLDMTKENLSVVESENKLLAKNNKELKAELATLLNPDDKVALPAGLKGRVIAVDPKFDFVVIDCGEDKGVLERGEMLVNRNGKLVGKIRIAAVQPKQSIANVLPQWKNAELEIMEGDQVLY